jgi:ribosomal protein S18 acetylase RimI-like enzyme
MTRLDRSSSDLPARIQENMIAYMRLFADLPGVAMEDGDTFWIVSGRGAPGNNILRVRWGEEGVEQRIDDLYAKIGQYIAEIEWMMFFCDQPAGLGKHLEARGKPAGPAGNWLWLDLRNLAPAPAVPDGFRMARVSSDQMMAEWVRTSEAGFEGELPLFYQAYARHGYGPAASSLHYTGWLGDIPVTSCTLLDAGGTAAIYDLSTLPQYRRQGLGGALSHAMLVETRQRGYDQTWIWSSNIARSLYQKLGFVEADFGIRAYL